MNRQKTRTTIAIVMILLFPVIYYYFSPYLVLMGAAEGIIAGDVIAFAGLFVTSLFFGRAWCGWVCPAGAMQELCSKVNGKPFNGRKRNLVKYFIWMPWLSIIVFMFLQAGGVKSVDPLYQTYIGISVQDLSSAIMFVAIAGAIAIFALVAGRRAACHTICWMAPFVVIGTRIKDALGYPSLHLVADKTQCVQCRQCSKNCPMSLNVHEMVMNASMANAECVLCGTCVETCSRTVIKYSFSSTHQNKAE